MAMNPDGPRHWTAEYIADVAERNGWSQQTRLTDNTKLDPAYVEYLKSYLHFATFETEVH